jgi:hypothetical protein
MDLDVLNEVYIVISIVVFSLSVTIAIKWKNRLDKKNLKLMQLYLELKFLYKNLNHSVEISSHENFCTELISSMKEYYNLEEIVIIDSIKMEFKSKTITLLKKEIYNFLQNNLISIREDFKNKNIIAKNVKVNHKKYILYIAELAPGISTDAFIICVENYPTLLSKNELLGLETNINLLKTRLYYD